jgi:predicted nucleotidyltransferase
MQIARNSPETQAGPSDWFTGSVYIHAVAAPSERSRLSASSVHLTPGDGETVIRDWPGRASAERLRHWPTLEYVAERVVEAASLDGLILIGSLAKGTADEASDLDLIVAVGEGRIREAWERRTSLVPPDALVAWDDPRSDLGREIVGRRFLSRDVVKVELTMATPSSPFRLAEPFVVAAGDDAVAERFARAEPIPPDVQKEYERELRDHGLVPEIELHYTNLMREIRAARRRA